MTTNTEIKTAERSKRIAAALSAIKQDYSTPDGFQMASTADYVADAVGQLIDAGLIVSQPVGAVVALPPVEEDKDMQRKYIPLPNGWEIQTKGKGSTFRICKVNSEDAYERWAVTDERLHEPLQRIAEDCRAALASQPAKPADVGGVDGLLPCPFCGAEPLLQEHEPHTHSGLLKTMGIPDHPGSFTIECPTDGCCGMIDNGKADVTANWNRRAALAAQTAAPQTVGGVVAADERVAFERHYSAQGFDMLTEIDKNGEHYAVNTVRAYWIGWSDRAAQPALQQDAVDANRWRTHLYLMVEGGASVRDVGAAIDAADAAIAKREG